MEDFSFKPQIGDVIEGKKVIAVDESFNEKLCDVIITVTFDDGTVKEFGVFEALGY